MAINVLNYSCFQEGAICVWDTNLHLETHVIIEEGEENPQAQRRRFKMWVTDVVYMSNCHKLAVASTSRDLRFFDFSGGKLYEEHHLYCEN